VLDDFKNEIINHRLLFKSVDELILHLDSLTDDSNEGTINGYNVKVGYTEIDAHELKIREDAITRILYEH